MTSATETQHRFDATILGKEVRGKKVMIKLDWKLPTAKYELHLYLDPENAQALNVGDRLNWAITRSGLGKDKAGNTKDGTHPTDYYWDWDKSGTSAQPEPEEEEELFGDPRAQEPQGRAESLNAGILIEGVVFGALTNRAVLIYNAERDISEPINYTRIKEIRDGLYHYTDQPDRTIMPLHYCYTHETKRKRASGDRWSHSHGDNFCTLEGLLSSNGDPVGEE